jgi:hypothetical protein
MLSILRREGREYLMLLLFRSKAVYVIKGTEGKGGKLFMKNTKTTGFYWI